MATTKIFRIKLRVGDEVMVRSGALRGKTGKVTAIHPRANKVTVEGINIFKKHQKPNQQYPKGAILEKTRPIGVSKVGIVRPGAKNLASRIGYMVKKDGTKTRVYRQASNKEIK